jgi:hypothetical protein
MTCGIDVIPAPSPASIYFLISLPACAACIPGREREEVGEGEGEELTHIQYIVYCKMDDDSDTVPV